MELKAPFSTDHSRINSKRFTRQGSLIQLEAIPENQKALVEPSSPTVSIRNSVGNNSSNHLSSIRKSKQTVYQVDSLSKKSLSNFGHNFADYSRRKSIIMENYQKSVNHLVVLYYKSGFAIHQANERNENRP